VGLVISMVGVGEIRVNGVGDGGNVADGRVVIVGEGMGVKVSVGKAVGVFVLVGTGVWVGIRAIGVGGGNGLMVL